MRTEPAPSRRVHPRGCAAYRTGTRAGTAVRADRPQSEMPFSPTAGSVGECGDGRRPVPTLGASGRPHFVPLPRSAPLRSPRLLLRGGEPGLVVGPRDRPVARHAVRTPDADGLSVRREAHGLDLGEIGQRQDHLRDRVHLVAPGYNRKTTLPFVGTQTWRVTLARAGMLRYLCDPHAILGMRGSAKIVA